MSTESLRDVIAHALSRHVYHDKPFQPWSDFTDAILAARYPKACPTCKGTGVEPTGAYTYEGEPLYQTCSDCPTLGKLLAIGEAVMTAQVAGSGTWGRYAAVLLDALRAVEP